MFKIILNEAYGPNDIIGGFQFVNGEKEFKTEIDLNNAAKILVNYYGCTVQIDKDEPKKEPDEKAQTSLKAEVTKSVKK